MWPFKNKQPDEPLTFRVIEALQEDGIRFELGPHKALQWLAGQMKDLLEEKHAPNYVELVFRDQKTGQHWALLCRRANGLTPGQVASLAKARVKELEARLTIEPGPFLFQFESFEHWCDTAKAQFKAYQHDSTNTICLDAKGRTCFRGADFMQAQGDGAFPVRVFSLIR